MHTFISLNIFIAQKYVVKIRKIDKKEKTRDKLLVTHTDILMPT